MTLIYMNSKELAPLPELLRLVLKHVYDNLKMSLAEEQRMQSSIVNWNNYIQAQKKKILDRFGLEADDFTPIGKKGTLLDEQEFHLQGLCWLLQQDEDGKLEARKQMFRNHKIDYKKFYKLPEVYTKQDFVKAQEALEKNKKEFPDMYEGSEN